MLEINTQIVFGKTGQKLRLGTLVDLANTVYQFPFTHMHILEKP